jgi:hypothetical protein
MASEVIENELRRHSWRVQDDIMEGVVVGSNDRQEAALRASHFLSEAELFELLEEVENEMQLKDEQHLEEILQQAQNEMRYWEHQVTDYEQWQSDQQKIKSKAVLCPICQDANLTQRSDGSILCPYAMDARAVLGLLLIHPYRNSNTGYGARTRNIHCIATIT